MMSCLPLALMNRLKSNRVCCLQTHFDTVFPKDIFSDYFEITTAGVVPSDGPKTLPIHR